MLLVHLVIRSVYVNRSGSLSAQPVGETVFEQGWESLICPDGADREVRSLYVSETKLKTEQSSV